MFDLINYLKFINELKGGNALDLGCHQGNLALSLKNVGYQVDAVDKEDFKIDGVNFIKADINDYQIKPNNYDLIAARFILPFLGSKENIQKAIDKMYEGLKPGGIMFYNYFGENDPYNISGLNPNMIFTDQDLHPQSVSKVQNIFSGVAFYNGPSTNKNGFKNWHVHSRVVKKV